MLEEEQISFRSASLMFDGVEDYAQQIAKMIGLSNEYELTKAGVSGDTSHPLISLPPVLMLVFSNISFYLLCYTGATCYHVSCAPVSVG